MRLAGKGAAGATLYVSLEPCDHTGLTPPCTRAAVEAGIARVVVGVADPNPRTNGAGIHRLREAGIRVDIVNDDRAKQLIAAFAVSIALDRPFVTLKMAASLDGCVAPRPGSYWLTGETSRSFVRRLRTEHDAVMVGGGTVSVDDPSLTVRPPHARRVPYVRACICDGRPVATDRRIFSPAKGYATTMVLAAGQRRHFGQLDAVANVIYVGEETAAAVDVRAALVTMKERGISSVLCEGGPRLAARLLSADVVDRVEWLVAPVFFGTAEAVRSLDGARGLDRQRWQIVAQERLGEDLRLSLRPVPGA